MLINKKMSKKRKFALALVVLIGVLLVMWFSVRPSNDRDWSLDQAVLPSAEINENLVTIHNIRNFTYASTTSYTPAYYDRTFDLEKIRSVDYVFEPFSGGDASAHTFVTFGFEGDKYVSISIEIRKEKGEGFSALKGLFKQYELMYVIADEKDVIKLRSNYRKDRVYLYPIKTTKEKMRALFLDMVQRANYLRDHPEFYNTITDTCTTNIAKHVNKISPKRVPFSFKILLPGYSDRLVYDLGLIDTDLPFDEMRAKYLINEKALKYADDPDFSVRIRE